jgi:hypothetical protein
MFGRESAAMLKQPLLEMFEEQQRIESALAMKDLSLANPITVTIKKPDIETGKVRWPQNSPLKRSNEALRACAKRVGQFLTVLCAEFEQGELDRAPLQWPSSLRCRGASAYGERFRCASTRSRGNRQASQHRQCARHVPAGAAVQKNLIAGLSVGVMTYYPGQLSTDSHTS